MNCEQILGLLSPYLDDEIMPSLREEMTRHIDSCATCRQALAQLGEIDGRLRHAPIPEVPEGLAARVLARARERIERRGRGAAGVGTVLQWWTTQTTALRLAVAAALILGLVTGLWMGKDFTVDPTPAADEPGPSALYNLDFLTDAPSGSLAQAYLTLTSTSNNNGA
jgi:anti-sigma factor RsiW